LKYRGAGEIVLFPCSRGVDVSDGIHIPVIMGCEHGETGEESYLVLRYGGMEIGVILPEKDVEVEMEMAMEMEHPV
jgi:hypothetical protein